MGAAAEMVLKRPAVPHALVTNMALQKRIMDFIVTCLQKLLLGILSLVLWILGFRLVLSFTV